ncbi:MAG TPA: alpha/beta fold hydrolase, partial [Gemmatimonadales bacterium]|nr:alpha/beta fold hydrolase [Gemmatimonadales bacterium]
MLLLFLLVQQASPCPANGYGAGADCRVLMVAENPEAPGGRKIPIRYALLKATGPSPKPEAVLLFSGGPGAASTEMVEFVKQGPLAEILQVRDVVLVDQRGSGGSNPLMCPAALKQHPERAFGTLFPPVAIKECQATLPRVADLTRYTTDYAIGDIELIRQELKYPKLILYGGSYGTRIAQAYARRFPDRTMALILDGVVPFDFSLPLSYAATLQESIDRIIARSDSVPDLRQKWNSLVARFKQGPVQVTVTPRSGSPVKVPMSLGDFGYAVRGVLYRGDLSRELPQRITEAATSGNLDWFAGRYYSRAADFEEDFADGLHLAAVCNEEVVWIKDADIGPATATSFIGTYLIDQYREACKGWPKAKVAADFQRPLTAPIPTLLVSGLFDPVTPP